MTKTINLRLFAFALLYTILGSAWAGTITFADLGLENAVQYSDPFDGGDFTVTFVGGANDGKYYNTGEAIRVFGNGQMVVEAKSGSLTQIMVTFANGDSYRPTSADVVDTGTFDPESGLWTGTATKVTFTRPAGSGHWRIQKVEATVNGSTPLPTISGTTPFIDKTTVTITPSNPNFNIFYTIDGSIPGLNHKNYNGPFTLDATTTVKAVESDFGGNLSPVAEKTFVKKETQQFPLAANIAAFNAMEDGTEATLTLNNVQVLFVGTNDIYVRDASGAIDFYRTGLSFIDGQVLNGQVTGKSTRYYSTPELSKTDNTNADNITTTSGSATAKVVTITQAQNETYYCDLIKIKGVKIVDKAEGNYTNYYAYLGSDSIQVYDKFKVGMGEWNTTDTYEVEGILLPYNGKYEIAITQPLSAVGTKSIINFSDPKVESLCVTNWDTDGDGKLSEDEAAVVTDLGSVFQNSQISSFNELKYFTGLGSIGNSAFSNSTVSSITLPENITSLGDYAFHKCTALKTIHLPVNVTALGKSALSRCTAMTAITVAEGNGVFCSIDGVLFSKDKTTLIQFPIAKSSAYIVPEGTTIVGTDAFYQSKLVAVNLPSSLKELAYDAFGYCQELTKMEIPEGVTTIGDYILDHCSALTTLHIPGSVTSIGQRICNGCNAITQVYSDIENPFEINSNCFTTTTYTNAKLHVPAGKHNSYASMSGWKEFKQIIENSQNIIFADSKVKALCVAHWDTDSDGELSESEASLVTSLGTVFQGSQIDSFHELLYFTGLSTITNGAFSNSLVKAITLPETITSLEEYAFYRCQSLLTINIPEKVQTIGTSALSYCTSLSAITVAEGNTAFCSIDGVLFTKDKTILIQFPIAKTTAYAVPEGTKTIGRDAFFKSKLESITLPSSLTELGYDAFGASKDLGRLIIPEGVTTIGDYILDQCYAIKVLHIPSSVTSIGQKICGSSNSITDVYCDIQNPFEINSNCFTTTAYTNATLHVPAGKRNEYAGTMGWREFRSIISDEVTYTLSIQSSAGGTITYNGTSITNDIQSFSVLEGYPITINISPETGYELKSLTVNGANVTSFVADGQYTITNITSNTSVVAQFSKKVYTLSISSSGNGQVSFNANIIEGGTQSFNVEYGTTAILSLTPQGGHMLSALSINGSNAISQLVDGKLTINNISENTSVIAVFEPIPVTSYTLSIQSTDGGTIVYNGVNVTNDTQSFSINEGASVSLAVVPNIGYDLSKLTLNGKDVTADVADGKYIIENLSENISISATFTRRSFNLSIESYGNGTVTFNSVPITNTTGNFSVLYGSSATMTLTPDMGYQVSSVKLNGENVTANVSDGSFTIPNITGNNTVRVDFEVIPVNTYSLTLVASIGGGITYNGATVSGSSQSFTVNEGASVSLTVSPDIGFELTKLTLNGNDVTSEVLNNKITISDISQNTTVEAIFTKKTYQLTIESTGGGQVVYGSNVIDNATNSFTVEYNASATLVVIPNEGYQLSKFTVNGKNVTAAVTNNIYTIANISSSQQVNVSFEKIPAKTFTLSINVGSGGVVSYNGVEVSNTTRDFIVNEGASTELDIVPDKGYRIKSVFINNKDMMSSIVDNSLSIKDIKSDTSVKVEFESIPINKYTILITVSSGGKLECNGMSISNDSRSIAIDEGSSIELTVLADVQYKLGKLTVDDSDMTSLVTDNKVVINNISHDLNINAFFYMITEDFTVNNVRYGIISSENRELEVQLDDYRGHVIIPNTVQHNGLSWMVTRIADHAFSGNPKLITVSIPSSVERCGKDVFANCSSLSAIIWQPMSPLSEDQAGNIENRNLLFYTSSEEYAPSGVSNVVVNNIAKQIRLLENYEFYCPQPFIAENISYTHHYIMETGIGESKGWETIVLPFDVKRITHSSKGEIVPFAAYTGGNNVHPFWLYGYDSVLGFVEATGIEANRPYIISMPNNPRYADEYILAGNVEFSADNVIVKSSADMLSVTHGDNRFCPTFQTTTKDVKALNVQNDFVNYSGGNKPGSTFIYGLREVRPFEAYMTSESGAFVSVAIFDDLPTTIGEIPEKDDYLCNRVTVYTTAGQVVRVVSNCTLEEALRSLAPGVYIVNGRKMVVR